MPFGYISLAVGANTTRGEDRSSLAGSADALVGLLLLGPASSRVERRARSFGSVRGYVDRSSVGEN